MRTKKRPEQSKKRTRTGTPPPPVAEPQNAPPVFLCDTASYYDGGDGVESAVARMVLQGKGQTFTVYLTQHGRITVKMMVPRRM